MLASPGNPRKRAWVTYRGGGCMRGYDRCVQALTFHHLGTKRFPLNRYRTCAQASTFLQVDNA
jgi:hypothetical protein